MLKCLFLLFMSFNLFQQIRQCLKNVAFLYLLEFSKLIEVINIYNSFRKQFMQPSKIEHADSIFDKKIWLNNIDFIKHCVVEEWQFFKSFIEKREWKGRF